MPFTCIHTGDWQLGLKLQFIPGDAGAQARLLRYQAVRAIADLARARRVDAVLVSGDTLDSNAAGSQTLQRAREALSAFAPIPVLLLPGNHDHAGPACALGRLAEGLPHVRVLDQRTVVAVAGATIHPCPLLRRHEREDPTAWLQPRGSDSGIRIAMAHGGVIDFAAMADDEVESPNLIDIQAVLAKDFDYVALGDWHGTLSVDRRAWYCGTPEPTRFKEKHPGSVLVVTIAAPGAAPQVEPVRIATTTWQRWQDLLADDAAIAALEARFDRLPQPTTTCIDLTLSGTLSLAGRNRLDAVLYAWSRRCMLLRADTTLIVTMPSEGDLGMLAEAGLLAGSVDRLRAMATPEAADALLLLHRLVAERSTASGI
ncbi:metallophosphatase [Planctomycetota bacterium]|nr:metallophosphatase [Planctomycetota bacterium]